MHAYEVMNDRITPREDLVGQPVTAVLADVGDTLDLITPSEPRPVLDMRGISLHAVAVDRGTSTPTTKLLLTHDGLLAVPLGGIRAVEVGGAKAQAVSAGALQDLVWALSGTNAELYAVGRPGAGQPVQMRVFEVGTGAARDVLLTGEPTNGRPLALTYRVEDDSLYLLDEVRVGPRRFLRLLHVSRTVRV
jgi:hypothetical protein